MRITGTGLEISLPEKGSKAKNYLDTGATLAEKGLKWIEFNDNKDWKTQQGISLIIYKEENMFKKSIMILFFLPFLIMACATTQTPLQKKLLTNSTPQFNGYITKIYKPIQPMYKPVESNFKLSISMVDLEIPKNSSTKKSTEYLEIAGNCKIEKLGDLLTWEYKLI